MCWNKFIISILVCLFDLRFSWMPFTSTWPKPCAPNPLQPIESWSLTVLNTSHRIHTLWTLQPWTLQPWTLKPWTLQQWNLNHELFNHELSPDSSTTNFSFTSFLNINSGLFKTINHIWEVHVWRVHGWKVWGTKIRSWSSGIWTHCVALCPARFH